jgi:salicylate hydroxylase
MAVEDGAVLGYLLGQVVRKSLLAGVTPSEDRITEVLALYESLRKSRTTVNVLGAVANRKFFHLHDGQEQQERDAALAELDWFHGQAKWKWVDSSYQQNLLGFDAWRDAEFAFEQWWTERESSKL